jgi:hypothetical protein
VQLLERPRITQAVAVVHGILVAALVVLVAGAVPDLREVQTLVVAVAVDHLLRKMAQQAALELL